MPSSPTEELRTATIRFPDGAVAGTIQHPHDFTEEELDRAANQVLVGATARKYGVPPDLALSVAKQESQFDQAAVSPKGARGVMQLMPDTAKKHGVDPADLYGNIEGGVRELRDMLAKYNDTDLALAAYNAGPGAVDQYRGVPPYKETRDYIARVNGFRAEFPEPQQVQEAAPSPQPMPSHVPGGVVQAAAAPEPGLLQRAGSAVVDSVTQHPAETVGGLLGGLGGALAGGPLLSAAGGVAGGTAGASLDDWLFGRESNVGGALARNVAGEALGYGVGKLARPLGRAVKDSAMSLLPDFQAARVPATLADLAGDSLIGRKARFAEQRVTGASNVLSAAGELAARAKVEAFRESGERLAVQASGMEPPPPVGLGSMARTAVQEKIAGMQAEADQLFNEARLLGGELMVPTNALKATAAKLIASERIGVPVETTREVASSILDASGQPMMREVTDTAMQQVIPPPMRFEESILADLTKLPDEIPYEAARELQRRFGARIPLESSIQGGIRKQLFKGISAGLESARPLESATPETAKTANELLTKARGIWRDKLGLAKQGAKQTALGRLADMPDDQLGAVVPRLMSPRNVGEVAALREVMDGPSWGLMERHAAEQMMERALREQGRKPLERQLQDLGDEWVDTFFSPPTADALRALSRIEVAGDLNRAIRVASGRLGPQAALVQLRNSLGLLIGGGLGGAAGNALGDLAIPLAGAGILIQGWAIPKLLTSERAAQLLTLGFVSDQAGRNGQRVAAEAMRQLVHLVTSDPEIAPGVQRVPMPTPTPQPSPVQQAMQPPNRKPLPEGL